MAGRDSGFGQRRLHMLSIALRLRLFGWRLWDAGTDCAADRRSPIAELAAFEPLKMRAYATARATFHNLRNGWLAGCLAGRLAGQKLHQSWHPWGSASCCASRSLITSHIVGPVGPDCGFALQQVNEMRFNKNPH